MKRILIILLLLAQFQNAHTQTAYDADSLEKVIAQQKKDTNEVNALIYLSNQQTRFDPAMKLVQRALSLAEKINYKKGEGDCFLQIAINYSSLLNDYINGIQNLLKALKIYEDIGYKTGIAEAYLGLQGHYREIGDYKNALRSAFAARQAAESENVIGRIFSFNGHRIEPLVLAEISQTYIKMNQFDSAEKYIQKSIAQNELFNGASWDFPIYVLGMIQNQKGKHSAALETLRSAIPLAKRNKFYRDTLQIYSGISTVYKDSGEPDSAIYYAKIVNESINPERETGYWLTSIKNLAGSFRLKGKTDSALKYTEHFYAVKDSLLGIEKLGAVQSITFNEKLKQQEFLAAQAKYKSKLQLYGLGFGLLVLFFIALLLWRSNQRKQKARNEIEKAYKELKQTQAQLIQSEKMASLGELTAGIAHEIQNPLNFVNNFSEVNNELADEIKNENSIEQIKAVVNDIKQNSEKILYHGKRADAIVKSMLQHSLQTSGKKEPTDINALCDEYLRLSYHGMRAKDKSFQADSATHFDEIIGKINIVPQDIGRVLLNLFNNAFYAVSEKKKQLVNEEKSGIFDLYQPTVSVSTAKSKDSVTITVSDNGNGIPKNIVDKIFQPFFTTKPTGSGTGLGLSLSYDIIKAHGGQLKVETKEGQGSEFTVLLPFV